MTKFTRLILSSFILLSGLASTKGHAVEPNFKRGIRLKDLVQIAGVQTNSLIGYGLVIGLPGTGDSASNLSTNKSVAHLLSRLGITTDQSEVVTKNIAAVIVTADLKPFAQVGDALNVRLSSVGDSSSLQGGTLLLTQLKGADGTIYATAQGHVSTGSSMAGSTGGSSASESPVRTVATSASGKVVRNFESSFLRAGRLELSLKDPDFTTASRLAQAINSYYSSFIANPKSSGLIEVDVPSGIFDNPSFRLVDFIASLEQIRIEPDQKAKIVIAERTGTIILGQDVVLKPVAISHGHIEIKIGESASRIGEVPTTTTIRELVEALTTIGAGPKDLVSILQALSTAGALNAELVFM